MAPKKDIAEIKGFISQINIAIADIRELVIKALLNENSALKARVRKLEIEVADNLQYQRRKNIVVSGIFTDIVDKMLEPAVVDILKKVNVVVPSREIEAVHSHTVNVPVCDH